MPEKVDLKRSIEGFRAKRGEFEVLRLPQLRYLMIDGSGDPNTAPEYAEALEALYPVAYKLKFASSRQLGATTSCLRWRGSGGRTTCGRSPRAGTSPAGAGP